ncbi:MAG: ABC transporter substrate-binding protein [Gemmatimonadota bacterium]
MAAAVVLLTGCSVYAPSPSPEPAPEAMEGPALSEGPTDTSAEREREAARLLEEAERALREGRFETVLARTVEIEDGFSDVRGTLRALQLRADAQVGLGEYDDAEESARRLGSRAEPGEPLFDVAALLMAKARVAGSLPGAAEALFDISETATDDVLAPADSLARGLADQMAMDALREVVDRAPEHPRILPVFLTELAVRRVLVGETSEGHELARRALVLQPGPETRERATLLLEGRVAELGSEPVLLGALLSHAGPPSLRQLSESIREGIELALLEAEESGALATVEVLDDQGSGPRAAELVTRLQENGVVGLIGPLSDQGVAAAATARRGTLPLLSPTARSVPPGSGGVFTLTGTDPAAARTLARLVVQQGVRNVVVFHHASPSFAEEAEIFRAALTNAGGSVIRTLSYNPETTSFAEPLGQVVSLRPQGFVLLLPAEDVELIAPQIAYFGVDDLDIRIFGNEVWSSDGVLESVPARHTEGVYTVSSRGPDGSLGPRWHSFVERYESHFQQTLRSPVAALGYDAARLLIYAAAQSDGSPEGTFQALASVRDFPGATGTLSVVDGRVQRAYLPVRIEARQPVPVNP